MKSTDIKRVKDSMRFKSISSSFSFKSMNGKFFSMSQTVSAPPEGWSPSEAQVARTILAPNVMYNVYSMALHDGCLTQEEHQAKVKHIRGEYTHIQESLPDLDGQKLKLVPKPVTPDPVTSGFSVRDGCLYRLDKRSKAQVLIARSVPKVESIEPSTQDGCKVYSIVVTTQSGEVYRKKVPASNLRYPSWGDEIGQHHLQVVEGYWSRYAEYVARSYSYTPLSKESSGIGIEMPGPGPNRNSWKSKHDPSALIPLDPSALTSFIQDLDPSKGGV